MRLLHLDCKNCGAAMEVRGRRTTRDEAACEFCGSTAFVEAREESRPLRAVGELRGTAADLARLDAAWRRQRRAFERTDQHGNRSVPSRSQAVGICIFAGLGLVVAGGMASASSPIAIVPLAMTALAVFMAVDTEKRRRVYEQARRRYKRRRRQIMSDGGRLKAALRPKADLVRRRKPR